MQACDLTKFTMFPDTNNAFLVSLTSLPWQPLPTKAALESSKRTDLPAKACLAVLGIRSWLRRQCPKGKRKVKQCQIMGKLTNEHANTCKRGSKTSTKVKNISLLPSRAPRTRAHRRHRQHCPRLKICHEEESGSKPRGSAHRRADQGGRACGCET